MKAEELDALFDENKEDILQHFDTKHPSNPNHLKRVNIDFPFWMVEALDSHATRLGVSRQALLKLWTAERLDGHHYTIT